ncbi:hypothetical protein [Jiangella aurantiaca]|uniref:hypothetical protein n=1 Tax=Jiangella aurantiaca TaxID=2530373 RepID=UPI00193C97FE|nr:hypothetical protein [Jiangella aurantiaca]
MKFDLLGLGMLSALRGSFDLLRDHHDVVMALHTVGTFQIESSAQMAALPRLRPRTFSTSSSRSRSSSRTCAIG